VILDDLVLDVADYMEEHPGGTFLLEHTIGSDISKFFYGGYSLDGNLTSDAITHFHSNVARA
jgi:cytochrome b involved in lipid metabolism